MYALFIQQIKGPHLFCFITLFSAKIRLSKSKKQKQKQKNEMAEHLTKQMTKPFFKDCFVASFDLVSLSSFRFVELSLHIDSHSV